MLLYSLEATGVGRFGGAGGAAVKEQHFQLVARGLLLREEGHGGSRGGAGHVRTFDLPRTPGAPLPSTRHGLR